MLTAAKNNPANANGNLNKFYSTNKEGQQVQLQVQTSEGQQQQSSTGSGQMM